MEQVADGAGRLVNPGLSTVDSGQSELAAALGQARDGVAAVQPQLNDPGGRRAVAAAPPAASCSTRRARRRTPLFTQLQNGLSSASTRIDTVRGQLATRTGPFEPLRVLHTLDVNSPGFFRSGYLTVAGIDGAKPGDREALSSIVDAPTARARRASS
jgi:hypothetical protein